MQFYGATTLHTKILRCWNEVPPESYDELKEKLLQAVFTYSKGPKIVTNRLCIGVSLVYWVNLAKLANYFTKKTVFKFN